MCSPVTHILGFGGYVPQRVVTNDDWSRWVDTSDEWITQRTGIKERRFAADDESTMTLAVDAAAVALKDSDLGPDDIDEIVLATDTPEMMTPDTAALVQNAESAGVTIQTLNLEGDKNQAAQVSGDHNVVKFTRRD